jgi:hypothetical protein
VQIPTVEADPDFLFQEPEIALDIGIEVHQLAIDVVDDLNGASAFGEKYGAATHERLDVDTMFGYHRHDFEGQLLLSPVVG